MFSSHLGKETKKEWFKPCAGCMGERPVVIWCQECKAGFCMEDFEARHSVGDYRQHRETAGKICQELQIQCDDCGESNTLASLTFCHQCNRFLCVPCDQFCHNVSQMVVHERQRYVVEAGSWMFRCSGCTSEQRAVVPPTLWCYDCGEAYCRDHCSSRHRMGKFLKHESHIEPIRAELRLRCTDCNDVFAVGSMTYCNECEAMFCKICCDFRHNDLADSHSISTYHRTGVVQASSDSQQSSPSLLNSASMVFKLVFNQGGDIHKARTNGQQTASSAMLGSSTQSRNSGMVDPFQAEGSLREDKTSSTLPAAEPPKQSVELQAFLEMMRQGLLVTRYTTSGETKSVLLLLAAKDTKFCYHPTQRSFSTKDPKARQIAVDRVVEVRAGTDPDPEYPEFGGTAVLRQSCKPVHANRALSLIAEFPPDKGEEDNDEEEEAQIVTWDFEFANAQDQQAALHGLRQFLAHTQKVAQWEVERALTNEEGGKEMKKTAAEGVAINEASEVRQSLGNSSTTAQDNTEEKYSFGLRQLENGNNAQAIEAFNKCLHYDEAHIGALYELGHLYQDMGDLDVAVYYFQKVLTIDPDHHHSHYCLGVLGTEKGDFQMAEDHLKKALELEPDNVDTLVNLGLMEMTRKQYRNAKSVLEKALLLATAKQQKFVVLYNLGNLAHATGKNMAAIDYFNRALGIDPEHADALFNHGVVYQEAKQYQKAYDSFQKAAELDPDMQEARLAATNLELQLNGKEGEQQVPEAKKWWHFKS